MGDNWIEHIFIFGTGWTVEQLKLICEIVKQVEGRSRIYVQHVNLAFWGGWPVNLRATRKFTGQ